LTIYCAPPDWLNLFPKESAIHQQNISYAHAPIMAIGAKTALILP